MINFMATVLGVVSIIFNGISMLMSNIVKAKVFLGIAILLIVPDLYLNGGLHGTYQSIIISIMCFLGALQLRRAEKLILYFIPFFSSYLLFGLQEFYGLLIVVASVTTSLATISKNLKIMKSLLVVSTLCWGSYALAYGAWFAFVFDVVGMFGLIIYFISPIRFKNK